MKTEFVYMTEMTDPYFHWNKIQNSKERPLIIYSKNKIPVDFLKENKDVGVNITITGWGNTWLEPNVPSAIQMIDYFNQLTNEIDINRIRLRIDPIIPTECGIVIANAVLNSIVKLPKTIISIIQLYYGQNEIFRELEINFDDYTIQSGRALFPKKQVAEEIYNSLIKERPESKDLISFCGMPYQIGNLHNGCVDDDMLKAIGVKDFKRIKEGYQRPGCKCVIQKKQLLFGKCEHGCKYCYAHKENLKGMI